MVNTNVNKTNMPAILFIETKICKNLLLERFRSSEVQKFKGSEVQRFRGSKVQRLHSAERAG